MSTSQALPSGVPATRNGNYNRVCQVHTTLNADTHVPRSRVPINHKPICAMTPGRGQPASQTNESHIMPTARQLLAEVHQTMFFESRRFDRDATVMDMILDHRLLICVASQPADGGRCTGVLRNCAPRCQAEIDAYWAEQEERSEFVSSTMSKNMEPLVSAERSTTAWPPNLDGDEVWDSAA